MDGLFGNITEGQQRSLTLFLGVDGIGKWRTSSGPESKNVLSRFMAVERTDRVAGAHELRTADMLCRKFTTGTLT